MISAINELKEDNSVESNPEETPEETPETTPGESGNDENIESGNNTESNSN